MSSFVLTVWESFSDGYPKAIVGPFQTEGEAKGAQEKIWALNEDLGCEVREVVSLDMALKAI